MDGNGLRELFLKISNGWHTYLPMKKVNANPLDEIPKTIVPELIRDLDQVKNRSEKYLVKGSGGKGNITPGPHVEIMNGRITTSPQSGYYVVYLFSADMERLYLSLAFGVTAFKEQFGESKAHHQAMQRSAVKSLERINLHPEMKTGVLDLISGPGTVVYDYQYSNIAAIEYDLRDLPDDPSLIEDLDSMLDLYEDVLFHHGVSLDQDMQTEIMPQKKTEVKVVEFALRKRKKGISKPGVSRKRRLSKSAQKTGNDGEKLVLEIEKDRLRKEGRDDLAEKVEHLAAVGKTPGYDIESFGPDGSRRRIEVKSGIGTKSVFELTRNEKNMAEKYGEEYVIAIVERIYRKPTVEFVVNPAGESWWNENNPSPLIWEVDLRDLG